MYAFNSPLSERDPSGLQADDKPLSVVIFENWIDPQFDNKKCGERASIGWIFRVRRRRDNLTYVPTSGVFVQKVTVTCTRKECACGICVDPETKHSYTFYEAFRIKGGIVIDENTKIGLDVNGRATDKAETASFKGTCGTHKAEGEVRFFPEDVLATITANWKPNLTHGGETNCGSNVGDLLSTGGEQPPDFWINSPFNNTFASASREISSNWECCGVGADEVHTSASPRKKKNG